MICINAHFYLVILYLRAGTILLWVYVGHSVTIDTPHAVARHFRVTPPNQASNHNHVKHSQQSL